MRSNKLTERESIDLADCQLTSLGIAISKGEYTISDVGDIFPGSVMIHDVNIVKMTYMNQWGCNHLRYSLEELQQMGDAYYKKFFYEEEIRMHMAGAINFIKKQETTSLFSYYEKLKIERRTQSGLYYTSYKLLATENSRTPSGKLIVTSTPVKGIGLAVNKLSKLVAESEYAVRNHKKYLGLTSREKQIISLLVDGKSSSEISDELFISYHTVTTHRKNIMRKLDICSFSELLKFANAFDLIRY